MLFFVLKIYPWALFLRSSPYLLLTANVFNKNEVLFYFLNIMYGLCYCKIHLYKFVSNQSPIMKTIFQLLFIIFASSTFSQTKTDSIASRFLGETRNFSLYIPSNYNKDKERKYPLLILLDGHYLFDPVVGALKYGNYWDDLPEVIVVGINQNETRETDCTIDENGVPAAEGIKFFEFINNELLPFVEKKYRIAPMRIIAGHDLTATFANLFLYQINPVFNGYISISPEIDNQAQARIAQFLASFKRPTFYYQAIADGDLQTTKEAVNVLSEKITKSQNSNINARKDEFINATHYSVVLHAIPNALYHMFSAYKPISNAEYLEKIVVLEKNHVLYLKQKYEALKNDCGIDMKIRFSDFKAIQTAIIKNKDYNALDELAILARKNYPKSMLADYFLAQQFENKQEDSRALKYYISAFQQEEIGDLSKTLMMDKADAIKSRLAQAKAGK